MKRIPITRVRMSNDEGLDALRRYVFLGRYGGVRVPRGVPPETVTEFIRKEINAETDLESFPRIVEVMRFYEASAAIPHLLELLERTPSRPQLPIMAAIVEITGDLGDAAQVKEANGYLSERVIPHAVAPVIPRQILAACTALASIECLAKYTGVLEAEQKRLEPASKRDEAGLREYAKVSAILKNDAPHEGNLIAAKVRISAQGEAIRVPELTAIYLRRSPFSNEYMDTWSGRMLRKIADEGDGADVCEAFENAMREVVDAYGAERSDFWIVRASQAIIYLQGKLSDKAQTWFAEAKDKAMNFLWDDL